MSHRVAQGLAGRHRQARPTHAVIVGEVGCVGLCSVKESTGSGLALFAVVGGARSIAESRISKVRGLTIAEGIADSTCVHNRGVGPHDPPRSTFHASRPQHIRLPSAILTSTSADRQYHGGQYF